MERRIFAKHGRTTSHGATLHMTLEIHETVPGAGLIQWNMNNVVIEAGVIPLGDSMIGG